MKTVNYTEIPGLVKRRRATVLNISQDGCPGCDITHDDLKAIERRYPRIQFLKMQAMGNQPFLQANNIQAVPTVFFLRKGKVVGRMVGSFPRPAIISKIEELLA